MGMDRSTSCHLEAGQGEGREPGANFAAVRSVARFTAWCAVQGGASRWGGRGGTRAVYPPRLQRQGGGWRGSRRHRWQRVVRALALAATETAVGAVAVSRGSRQGQHSKISSTYTYHITPEKNYRVFGGGDAPLQRLLLQRPQPHRAVDARRREAAAIVPYINGEHLGGAETRRASLQQPVLGVGCG